MTTMTQTSYINISRAGKRESYFVALTKGTMKPPRELERLGDCTDLLHAFFPAHIEPIRGLERNREAECTNQRTTVSLPQANNIRVDASVLSPLLYARRTQGIQRRRRACCTRSLEDEWYGDVGSWVHVVQGAAGDVDANTPIDEPTTICTAGYTSHIGESRVRFYATVYTHNRRVSAELRFGPCIPKRSEATPLRTLSQLRF